MVFCLDVCEPLLPHRLSWEYRISNPLRTRSLVMFDPSGTCSFLGYYVHLPASVPMFNSGTGSQFIMLFSILDSYSGFNVIQLISRYRRSHSDTDDSMIIQLLSEILIYQFWYFRRYWYFGQIAADSDMLLVSQLSTDPEVNCSPWCTANILLLTRECY